MVESIRTRRAFSALSSSRNRGRSGPVWVVRADAPADPEPSAPRRAHVAYAIGKAAGGAVVRNRLRRRLRALVSGLERDGALSPGLYLVGVSPAATTSSFDDLRRHLASAVSRLTNGGTS